MPLPSTRASTSTTASPARASWRWLIAAIAVAVVVFLVISMQVGTCVDYASAGPESTCTVEPAIGVPGAWVIGIAGVLFVGYAFVRAFRRR